jgi:hypothetical protein
VEKNYVLNAEVYDFYSSSNIVWVIKSRKMFWAYGGEDKYIQRFGGESKGKEATWKTWA